MSVSPEECAQVTLEVVPEVMRAIRAGLRQHRHPDLNVTQFRILTFISRTPEASLSDLAEHIGLTLPTLSKIVDGLVTRQLVSRESSSADRRRISLGLTPAGKAMMLKTLDQMRSRMAAQFAGLDNSQRERVIAALYDLQAVFSLNVELETGEKTSGG